MLIADCQRLRRHLQREDYIKMLRYMGNVRKEYCDSSLREASMYAHFVEKGGTEDAWKQLDDGSKADFSVKGDALEYLLASGWFVDDFLFEENGLCGDASWQNLPLMYACYVQQMLRDCDPERDQVIHDGIHRMLLESYLPVPVQPNQQCHIGHLLHGLVALVQKYKPEGRWSEDIMILDLADARKRKLFARIQRRCSVIFGILCSNAHWGLVVGYDDIDRVVLYDGQANEIIYQRACKWAADFFPPRFKLIVANVPRQTDDWSCGHRVLLAADLVMQSLFLADNSGLPVSFPDDFADEAKIASLTSLVAAEGIKVKVEVDASNQAPDVREEDTGSPAAKRRKSEEAEDKLRRYIADRVRRGIEKPQPKTDDPAPSTPRKRTSKKRKHEPAPESPKVPADPWRGSLILTFFAMT